jgi:hypothetical protein
MRTQVRNFLPIKNTCMKSHFTKLMISACLLLIGGGCVAQVSEPRSLRTYPRHPKDTNVSEDTSEGRQGTKHWPKVIRFTDGSFFDLYKPRVTYFRGNVVKFRAVVSLAASAEDDPVFGVAWTTDTVEVDRDKRDVMIRAVRVNTLKVSGYSSTLERQVMRASVATGIRMFPHLPLDEVLASLDGNEEARDLAGNISNQLPTLIFRKSPTMLVLIDGEPILKNNKDWGLDVVVNSPFTIVRDDDHQFYLYTPGSWYVAAAAVGPYVSKGDTVSSKLKKIGKELEKAAMENGEAMMNGAGMKNGGGTENGETNGGAKPSAGPAANPGGYDIVVSTTPAELIETDGQPDLQPVTPTSLRYVANSANDILFDTATAKYYLLLAGRWFRSDSLNDHGRWEHVAADKLPLDFLRIPKTSPKSNVLVSVAGTKEAQDAILDAEVPAMTKVDRKGTSTEVAYDGDPQFSPIQGTDMEYAVNTCATVINSNDRYYALDDGIWFVSANPQGPWVVSVTRPDQMDLVPPECPVYHARFVEVYEVRPDFVFDGYTPGYLNSYIDGNCLVYGTGFYYQPWLGGFYYPQPWTWGFCMCYDPWYGWEFGMDYMDDIFDCGWGFDAGFGFAWGGGSAGSWRGGPAIYHQLYRGHWHGRRFRYDRHGDYGHMGVRGRRGPQGQWQQLVHGQWRAVPASAIARAHAGGSAGLRANGGTQRSGGTQRIGGSYAAGGYRGGGGYTGGRVAGGGGSTGGGHFSGGGSSGGGGGSSGGGGHVSSGGSSGGGGGGGGGGVHH